jgi:hypothetical protein
MHIQHIESTSGHTVNIAAAPSPRNTKLIHMLADISICYPLPLVRDKILIDARPLASMIYFLNIIHQSKLRTYQK